MNVSKGAESQDDPYADIFMEVGNNRITRGAPVLLESAVENKLNIRLSRFYGAEFRLAVISDEQSLPEIFPDSDTWVKVGPGHQIWSITPKIPDSRFKLVLYTRDFNEVMEFDCESYPTGHPWFSSSKFYAITPTNNGFFAHKGVLRLTQTDYAYNIQLWNVDRSLVGKKIKLTMRGERGVPNVTPSEPQIMGNINLSWRFSFDELGEVVPVTALFEAEGIPSTTWFDFSPTADAATETVSSNIEHHGSVENLTDSAKE